MHELSLCARIVEIIEEQAGREKFSRVTRVHLEIGALAGVEVEALRFGFDVATTGTAAAGAVLEISQPPGRAWCGRCRQDVQLRQRLDSCPRCGGYDLTVTGGDALCLKALEVS